MCDVDTIMRRVIHYSDWLHRWRFTSLPYHNSRILPYTVREVVYFK